MHQRKYGDGIISNVLTSDVHYYKHFFFFSSDARMSAHSVFELNIWLLLMPNKNLLLKEHISTSGWTLVLHQGRPYQQVEFVGVYRRACLGAKWGLCCCTYGNTYCAFTLLWIIFVVQKVFIFVPDTFVTHFCGSISVVFFNSHLYLVFVNGSYWCDDINRLQQ